MTSNLKHIFNIYDMLLFITFELINASLHSGLMFYSENLTKLIKKTRLWLLNFNDFKDEDNIDEKIKHFTQLFSFRKYNYPHLRGKNYKYKKFIILGNMRTGSTLLSNLLMTHSRVICYHELFQNKPTFIYPGFPLSTNEKLVEFRDQFPVKFLKTFVYKGYNKDVNAVGFKIFYNHALKENQLKVWEYLRKLDNLFVIQIIRSNLLESYVSLKLALQTKHWAKVNEDVYVKINENDLYKYFLHGSYSSQHETSRISVDFNDCLDYFNEVEFQIAEAEKQFSHVQICKIQYEDLVLNQEKELNKIFKYLGLENEVLVNTVQKQNNRSYREIIINYDELKNYFINTKWSTFFKE